MKHLALLSALLACGGTNTGPAAGTTEPRPRAAPVAKPAPPPVDEPEPEPEDEIDRETGKFIDFELLSDRPQEAADFYTALFGWGVASDKDVWTLSNHGRVVGRIHRRDASSPVPAGWLCWISVDDVDDLSRDVPANGGSILLAARDTARGREAIVEGPTGGVFGVLDPKKAPDLEGRLRAGDFVLSQLWTRDYERAFAFYSLVGDYTSKEIRFGATRYRILENDDAPRAIIRLVPTGRTARWLPFVMVDDVKQSVARARQLHARVVTEPRKLDSIGQVAVIESPSGGVLGMIQPVENLYAPRQTDVD